MPCSYPAAAAVHAARNAPDTARNRRLAMLPPSSDNPALPPLRVREFFLARQPILDRQQALVAYELLFRNADVGQAAVVSDISATASVIEHASHLGMDNVVGDFLGYLNVDGAVLMSDIFEFLPREKVVLEIVETVKVTDEILDRVGELARAGFRFALDDVISDSDDVQKLLPQVEIIKMDLQGMPTDTLIRLVNLFKQAGKKLLAEKVETQEQFEACLALGFDYFQGYYFAKPAILRGKKLMPSQLAALTLMKQIDSDVDNAMIEETLKKDVSLCLNLLRLVNTPAVGARRRIDSVTQALLVLGRQQLQRWLQITLYAESSRKWRGTTPLLILAATRGKLLELMSQRIEPGNRSRSDTAFTVGIMSLLDTLFAVPMEEILAEVSVVSEVSEALLRRQGHFGDLLKLAECTERLDQSEPLMLPLLDKLGLSSDDLCPLQLAAFKWSDSIARTVR